MKRVFLTATLLLMVACTHQSEKVVTVADRPCDGCDAALVRQVHFPTGSFRVQTGEAWVLDRNAAWIKDNPRSVIVLEGHCDERGSDDFNLELGDRRARFVKDALVKRGADPERLVVMSYGERKPLDPLHGERVWRKNRRVEFVVR